MVNLILRSGSVLSDEVSGLNTVCRRASQTDMGRHPILSRSEIAVDEVPTLNLHKCSEPYCTRSLYAKHGKLFLCAGSSLLIVKCVIQCLVPLPGKPSTSILYGVCRHTLRAVGIASQLILTFFNTLYITFARNLLSSDFAVSPFEALFSNYRPAVSIGAEQPSRRD